MWAAGLAASVPIIVACVRVVNEGWLPLADDGLIAVSALDVLSLDTPLLGAWSSGYSGVNGEATFHPGPLLFWLLAVPARLPGAGWMEITVSAVNVAAVIGIVALARRWGGIGLMIVVACGTALMLASLPAEAYSDIWNPSAPLMPFILLVFLCWSLACGEHRLLPLTVLVASYSAQGHLSYLTPVAVVLAVGLGGLVLARRLAPNSGSARNWVLAAAAVGLVCWSGPLIDQAINRPGNMVLVVRAATTDQDTVGWATGGRAVVRTVGVPPWWLREPRLPLERVVDLTSRPAAGTIASAAVILVALAVLALLGLRRRRADVVAANVLGLALCAALALVTSATPQDSFATLGYGLWWASGAGLWVWTVAGWSALTLYRPALRLERRRSALAVAGVALAALVGAIVAGGAELPEEPYGTVATVGERLPPALEPGRPVSIEVASSPEASLSALGLGSGVLYALRREGFDVSAPIYAEYLGAEYRPRPSGDRQIVHVDVDRRPRAGRVVARLVVRDAAAQNNPLASTRPAIRTLWISVAAPPQMRARDAAGLRR